jgi:hypothetical protein
MSHRSIPLEAVKILTTNQVVQFETIGLGVLEPGAGRDNGAVNGRWRARARSLLRSQLWVSVLAVLVGVTIGYLTELVAGDDVTLLVVVGFGVAVGTLVVLTVLMAGRAERERLAAARRSRAEAFPPLSVPALSPDEKHTQFVVVACSCVEPVPRA